MRKHISFLFFAVLVFNSSCNYLVKKKPNENERVLARVEDDFLYLSDVQPLVHGFSKDDSAKLVAAYTESWVKKNLMLKKAQEYISEEETGIKKKVENYRESLLLYEYEKELIKHKLNDAVNEEEIEDYYEKNSQAYILERDVSLASYIIIDQRSSDFDLYKSLFKKIDDEDNSRTVAGYCESFAKKYNIEGAWRTNSAIASDLGLTESQVHSVAVGTAFKEFFIDENLACYLRIKDVKHKGEPIPLPLVKEQILEILLNKKKIVLLRDMYEKLLDESMKKNEVEIIVK